VLSFYVFDHGIQEGTSGQPNNYAKSLYRILDSWEENSVTWDNLPAFSNAALDNNSNTAVKVWEDYTVTSAIKDIIEDNGDNSGFILKFPYEDDFTGARIRSSEAPEQSERPRLTVTYNLDTEIDHFSSVGSIHVVVKQTYESILLCIPFMGLITISDVKGRTLTSFRTDGQRQWYRLPRPFSSGIAVITIRNSEKTFVDKTVFLQ